ncbi:MAG: hypothetical protein ACLTZT_20190 [Butyricimonas faecalis]
MISDLIRKNEISEIIPYPAMVKLWIYQQAWFSIADLDKDFITLQDEIKGEPRRVYLYY